MTGLPIQPIDEELQTLQREVQRMLGRCLLRLQQYEQLMKAIVAHHEISASGSPLESNQAERVADAANKTLGTLVGTLLGTYVTSGDQDDVAEPDAPDNIISFKMKMSLRMSAEDFDTTQKRSEGTRSAAEQPGAPLYRPARPLESGRMPWCARVLGGGLQSRRSTL